jgi:hypothetical protein
MKISAFKKILLKKAKETTNPYLQDLLVNAKDEMIVNAIMESLEKMAQPSAAMGRGANSAITAFAGHLTKGDVEQVRDALAHHVSRYRGALKSNNRKVADQHLNHIIPMMHTIARASKHSDGNLAIDYRSTIPWESNYTTTDRHPNGKRLLIEGTKDLGRRPKTVTRSERGVPNWHYLEMAPHADHSHTSTLPLPKSGYPFEEIQVGSQDQVDQGKAWLPIENIDNVSEYVPHPFDNHPIHSHADKKEENRSQEERDRFTADLVGWKNSDHHKNWLAAQKEKYTADPENYKLRGSKKPAHFWEGLSVRPQPLHARTKKDPNAEDQRQSVEAPTEQKPVQAHGKSSDEEVLNTIRSTLKPEQLKSMTPSLKRILGIED